jgi:hypothetical protein
MIHPCLLSNMSQMHDLTQILFINNQQPARMLYKSVSVLIKLSLNSQKPTLGLIALTGSQVHNISFYLFVNMIHCTDTYYIFGSRLWAARLLPLGPLVEGDNFQQMLRHQDHTSRFGLVYPFVCALVDWCPEMHTFHFPWGRWRSLWRTWPSCLGYPM